MYRNYQGKEKQHYLRRKEWVGLPYYMRFSLSIVPEIKCFKSQLYVFGRAKALCVVLENAIIAHRSFGRN